jgi:hypothetical protein
MAAIETLIQNDFATILKAIGLSGMDAANVGKIREQPKVDEVIDGLPTVLICQRGAPPPDGLSFEGTVGRVYVEEVIIIGPREGDAITDQDATLFWYQQCLAAIQNVTDGSWRSTLPIATTVYDIRVSTSLPGFERSKLSDNYAYLSFFVTVRSAE